MTEHPEDADPEQLRRQLEEIKGAMGLAEQYPGRARLWLVGGIVIGVAAILVQGTFFLYRSLSGAQYVLIWVGFVVVAVAALWVTAVRLPTEPPPATAPNWRALFASMAAFLVAITSVGGQIASVVDGLTRAVFYFGAVIATLGLTLLLVGVVLRAYRVRTRDRAVFYLGGLWVLAFAGSMPYVELLRFVGLGTFGLLFVLYSGVAYAFLAWK